MAGGVGGGVAGEFGPDGAGVRVVAVVGIGGIVVGESGMLDAWWWCWEGEGEGCADKYGGWEEEFHFDRERI